MRPFLACVEDSRAIASRLAIKRATADPQSMARSTFLSLSLPRVPVVDPMVSLVAAAAATNATAV